MPEDEIYCEQNINSFKCKIILLLKYWKLTVIYEQIHLKMNKWFFTYIIKENIYILNSGTNILSWELKLTGIYSISAPFEKLKDCHEEDSIFKYSFVLYTFVVENKCFLPFEVSNYVKMVNFLKKSLLQFINLLNIGLVNFTGQFGFCIYVE